MALTVAQLVARVTADTSGFYKSMAIMNSTLIRTGSFASRALAGVGLAATGIGILSLRAAGNFQQAMNILQAVSGATAGDMKALRQEAINLGMDFKLPNVSAKDAADAMVELSKAGLSTNQILGATRGALQLGLAANIGFADSAQLTARSLKAFDLDGSQATRVANLFAAGANKSTAEITDLALGVQNAGAQFHGVGYSIEDLTASLSIMADNALSGEYAGTALKTMLIRLTSPTAKAEKEMKKWGISVFDAHGRMKAMPDVIAQFQRGLGGLTQQQREQALTTIFGVRANQAMRILMNEGAASYRKYREEVTGTNAAQKIAEARTKGFNGALGALGSAVETQAILLGDYFLPAMEALIRALAGFVAAIDISKITGFFDAIADGVRWFKNLADQSVALRAVLLGVGAAFAGFLIVSMVTSLVAGLTAAVIALGAALMANPIALVAAALIGLGVALYYAYTHSERFREIVNAAFDFLKSLIPSIVAFGRSVVEVFQNLWSLVGPILTAFANGVKDRFMAAYNFVRQNMDLIKTIVKTAFDIVYTTISTIVQNVLSVIRIFAAVLRGDWGKAWDEVKAIVSRTLSAIWNNIKSSVSLIKNAAILLGKAVWAGMQQEFSTLRSKVVTGLQTIWDAITAVAGSAAGWAVAIGKAIVQGILDGLTSLPGRLGGFLGRMVKKGIDIGRATTGSTTEEYAARTIGADIPAGITRGMLLGFEDLPQKLSDKVRTAIDAARKVIQEKQGEFTAAWNLFFGDIGTLFDAQTEQFRTKSEKLLAAFDLRQQVKANKEAIDELVAKMNEAQQKLLVFSATPRPTLTREEGESDESFRAREIAAEQEWQAKYSELQKGFLDAQAALQDEKDKQRLEAKRLKLEADAAEERKQYTSRRNLQKRHLGDSLQDLVEALQKHPEKHRVYQDKIIALLKSYGIHYRGAGQALGDAFAAGLRQSFEDVERAAREMAQLVLKYLKTSSPAEVGPLSTLDKWWTHFSDTLVSGLETDAISRAATSLANSMGILKPTGSLAQSAGALATSTTAGPNLNVYVNVEGSLIKQQDLADELYKLISQQSRRGKTLLP